MINGLNHINVVTCDLDATLTFYGALGCKVGYRPGFDEPGIWLYAGEPPYQILHVNVVDQATMAAISERGVLDHIGFNVRGKLKEVTDTLDALGIDYDLWPPIKGSHRALYIRGPSNEKIEFVLVDEPIAGAKELAAEIERTIRGDTRFAIAK